MKSLYYFFMILFLFGCSNSNNETEEIKTEKNSTSKDSKEISKKTVGEIMDEAGHLMMDSLYEEAILMYNIAIERDSDNLKAMKLQANCYARFGDHESALEVFSEGLELDNSDDELYLMSGSSHLLLGNFEEAIFAFQKVIELKPDNISAPYNIGSMYYNRWLKEGNEEDKIKGCKYFKKAADLGSDFANEIFSKNCNI